MAWYNGNRDQCGEVAKAGINMGGLTTLPMLACYGAECTDDLCGKGQKRKLTDSQLR